MEKLQIIENIEISFKGSLATGNLFNHFSTVSTVDETTDNYAIFCHDCSRWYTKNEIRIVSESQAKSGKAFKKSDSVKLAGWKIVLRQSASLIIGDNWSDSLTRSQVTKLVNEAWDTCEDDRAKEIYRNAVVYNNLSAYKAGLSAKSDSTTDNSETTFSLLEVLTELIGKIDLTTVGKKNKADIITDYTDLVKALQIAITK